MDDDFRKAALDYHRYPRPGKLAIEPTKRMATQRDLALAYSPGVAAACEAIVADPDRRVRLHRARQSGRRHLQRHRRARPRQYRRACVGKPVMEGKAVLFKKFAGIDVFDIEVDAADPDASSTSWRRWSRPSARSTSRTSRRRSASAIEAELRAADEHPGVPRRPARHGDHRRGRGDATACKLQGKTLEEVKLVTSGAGAAALACVDLLVVDGPDGRERHR